MRLSSPAAALLAGASFLALAAPAADGDTGTSVRRDRAAAAAQQRAALLELYAVDSRLDATRGRLAALAASAHELARERARLALRLRAAKQTLGRAEQALGSELRALFEQSQPDALAVFLSASSLQDALDGVDDLARAASATQSVIAQARAARADVARLGRRLARAERNLRVLRLGALGQLAALERARGERTALVGGLERRQQLDTRQLAALERRARAAEERARAAEVRASLGLSVAAIGTAPADPPPVEPRRPASTGTAGTRTLVVVSTGYSLIGSTATGLPVGYGVAAVDPTVIPLGTRLTIPGYGEAVAADTGSAIRGVRIDLWFPTRQEAEAWGWQTLTITLH